MIGSVTGYSMIWTYITKDDIFIRHEVSTEALFIMKMRCHLSLVRDRKVVSSGVDPVGGILLK